MSEFDYESQKWTREVDAEAAQLVRQGVPPWDAIQQARDAVARRRRQASFPERYPLDQTCPWPSQKPGSSR